MMSGDVGMVNGQVTATVAPLQQFDATLLWRLEKMGHDYMFFLIILNQQNKDQNNDLKHVKLLKLIEFVVAKMPNLEVSMVFLSMSSGERMKKIDSSIWCS
ncbi:hypothetical protein TSUD_190000 [Trifolium subterraneum]|uniref:Uncharacterized protein n=1 Tax=Trifolium subterraneum TaxID=3900 RepID=A0A2Z6NF22_TRISU|nr:hypothetical protein TSUD_190000 [Trifolium subterraneum]